MPKTPPKGRSLLLELEMQFTRCVSSGPVNRSGPTYPRPPSLGYEMLSWVPAGDRPVLVWAAFWPVVLYRTRGVFSHLSPAGTCGPTVSPAGRLRRVSSARGRLCGMITVCSSLGSVDQAGAFQTPPPFDANVFGPSSG